MPAEAAVAEAVEGTEQSTARFAGVGPWRPVAGGRPLMRRACDRNVGDKCRLPVDGRDYC